MDTINNLFVYGTLAPGCPNEHILQKIGGSWQDASVTGKFYQKGWGASMGYPAIILDKKGEKIDGFLFSSKNLSAHLHDLDEFEGKEYKRIIATVKLKDETEVNAFIYSLKEK